MNIGDKIRTKRSLYLYQNGIQNMEGEIVKIMYDEFNTPSFEVKIPIKGEDYFATLFGAEFILI